jgi:hypothetical protein
MDGVTGETKVYRSLGFAYNILVKEMKSVSSFDIHLALVTHSLCHEEDSQQHHRCRRRRLRLKLNWGAVKMREIEVRAHFVAGLFINLKKNVKRMVI